MESDSAAAHSSQCVGCGQSLLSESDSGLCPRCLLAPPPESRWAPHRPPTHQELSQVLPRFEIRHQLGRGGVGAVLEAFDRKLSRTVAIKAMWSPPENLEYAARFEREASALAQLMHRNIVVIHDVGREGSLHFIVMEKLEESLNALITRSRRLDVAHSMRLLKDVCEGIDHAHREKVIHRDIKPSNVLIDRFGNAKIGDFGLVKGVLGTDDYAHATVTKSGMTLGTPYYMAPEQIENPSQADHRADIYAIAAVFHEMLTGEPPKPRQERDENYRGVPRCYEAIVNRGLNGDPQKRYSSALSFYNAVEEVQMARRKRWLKVAVVAALAVVGLASGLGTKFFGRSDYRIEASTKAKRGLPLGDFGEEWIEAHWVKRADYDFDQALGDQTKPPFELLKGAVAKDGLLELNEWGQTARVELKRPSSQPCKGLALNFRFKPEKYLAVGRRSIAIVSFELHWTQGVFLTSTKWGDPRPTFLLSKYQPLAPPGVIEPKLEANQWHEIWLVISDGYRLWIDGRAVYRSLTSEPMDDWDRWTGEETATLSFEGFRGWVDYVRVWEKR